LSFERPFRTLAKVSKVIILRAYLLVADHNVAKGCMKGGGIPIPMAFEIYDRCTRLRSVLRINDKTKISHESSISIHCCKLRALMKREELLLMVVAPCLTLLLRVVSRYWKLLTTKATRYVDIWQK
jgi:hypothetical protein